MSKGAGADPIATRGVTRPARAPKTAERVAGKIRNAIIRGDLVSGDSIRAESHLIAKYAVSRPTVREAVRILESEGLLVVTRGARDGARVTPPGFEMIQRAAAIALQAQGVTIGDLYEMHAIMGPPVVRLVVERNRAGAVPALRALIADPETLAKDRAAAIETVTVFHRLLVEMAGNQTLLVITQALEALALAHIDLAGSRDQVENPGGAEHQLRRGLRSLARLVDLIEAGDGPGAEAHWRAHMMAAGEIWMEHIGADAVVDLIG